MKKLGKLTLNEMQDFVPLSQEEQIAMKGGTGIWPIVKLLPWAWEVAGTISDYLWGSGDTSQGSCASCPPGSIAIHESDSVSVNGIKIYNANLICIPQ